MNSLLDVAARIKNYCIICGPKAPAKERLPERLVPSTSFSARQAPHASHFRVMECLQCGLVYSDGIFPTKDIENLYRTAPFATEPQLANMCRDYMEAMKQAIPSREMAGLSLLEVGCANGFFLKAAQDNGFRVTGVELSDNATAHALTEVKSCIINDFFHEDLFVNKQFDVVCCFQVLDHLLNPAAFLKSVRKILRPGGVFLAINHDIGSIWPCITGKRSILYTIEHIYLFDKKTMRKTLEKVGFEVVKVAAVWNRYTLAYGAKIFPFPGWLRTFIMKVLQKLHLTDLTVRLPCSNMLAIARKPKL